MTSTTVPPDEVGRGGIPVAVMNRPRLLALASLVTLAMVATVLIVPVQRWADRREHREVLEAQLESIEAANARTSARIELLHTDREIERLAREQYNLVRPGESVFGVLPPPEGVPDVFRRWPFHRIPRAVVEQGRAAEQGWPTE